MTFSSTVKGRWVTGEGRIVTGTWDADAVTTGNIDCKMSEVYDLQLTEKGSAAPAGNHSGIFVDTGDYTAAPHAVTIYCKVNASGSFTAVGRG